MNGGVTIPDKDTAKALNDLARHKAIVHILNDIRMDMEICEIEGWDKNEYLNLIRQLLNSIGGKTMNDSISRQAAIDCVTYDVEHTIECLKALPSAQPDNQINLCDSCDYLYPECPSEKDDVIFGNGIGNDNICACNKYKPFAQPEQRWIPCSERLPAVPWCRCLITRDDGRGGVTVKEALFSFGRWYDNEWLEDGRNRKFNISESIIAWAPFPAPYRGGEKAK